MQSYNTIRDYSMDNKKYNYFVETLGYLGAKNIVIKKSRRKIHIHMNLPIHYNLSSVILDKIPVVMSAMINEDMVIDKSTNQFSDKWVDLLNNFSIRMLGEDIVIIPYINYRSNLWNDSDAEANCNILKNGFDHKIIYDTDTLYHYEAKMACNG